MRARANAGLSGHVAGRAAFHEHGLAALQAADRLAAVAHPLYRYGFSHEYAQISFLFFRFVHDSV